MTWPLYLQGLQITFCLREIELAQIDGMGDTVVETSMGINDVVYHPRSGRATDYEYDVGT